MVETDVMISDPVNLTSSAELLPATAYSKSFIHAATVYSKSLNVLPSSQRYTVILYMCTYLRPALLLSL